MRTSAHLSYRGIVRALDGAVKRIEWFGNPTQSGTQSEVAM